MNWIKPEWPVARNVYAATTLRTGGWSIGGYRSLNPALHVGDAAETVFKNRRELTSMLNLPSQPMWLEQVHGNHVVKADLITQVEKADASYTDQANVVCAVLTADCLPILLASSDGCHIAAIHAGWRGLLDGIIGNTVDSLGTMTFIAWLGPAIGPTCFEVGREVRTSYIHKSVQFSSAFIPVKEDKYMADIYQLARIELGMSGINQVYGGDFCTVSDKERFYSYRRDGKTGRMATLIWRD